MKPAGPTGREPVAVAEVADELYRILVETVREYAIFALDPTGHIITWNSGAARITVTWRPSPSRLDGDVQRVPLRTPGADTGESGPEFFYLRGAPAGVYTVTLNYERTTAAAIRPVLYVAGAGGVRSLPPVTLDGSGRAMIARLLLPHGVLWEQDDWFTGRSVTADTVTKFRLPEGVTWTERRTTVEQ